jgi:PAS domain S-box-containing protein
MTKDHQKRHAARDGATGTGARKGRNDCPVIVVGIGVPEGGLESLKRLFADLPPGHGVAFVLIGHLEPSGDKPAGSLLGNGDRFMVVEATDGMEVLADRIHVVPPDKLLGISRCQLSLHEPAHCNGLRMPVDHFFCALAADQRRRACGIVLAGGGSDGTIGLSEIKAAGGRTLVEDPGGVEPSTTQRSDIDPAVVDAFLTAGFMADQILALAEQVTADTRGEPAEAPEYDADLRAVMEALRAGVGYDFGCYKPNTLVRRIRRRMTLAKIETFADYARFLHDHPDEVGLLQKDFLIGVTEFFRQPRAWEILEEKVIGPLVELTQPGSEIRVWSPGCSTGKEAYSLAMLLFEQVEKSGKQVSFQIFATDYDAAALATARSGSYSEEEIGGNVSPERLKRFFARKDGRLQILKEVRDQVVFAPQNLTSDPPFSRLDLISCRNLLIYLDQQVQKKVIALFHFALRDGGFLFLGNAETVGDREDLFEPVSKKWRIYRRIGVGRRVSIEIPVHPAGEVQSAPGKLPVVAAAPRMGLALTAQQVLLERFAPACVIIDRKLQVLYVHGAVENYLTFPTGELATRVVDMAREGLRARLRGAIGKCIEVNRSVSVTARVRRGEKSVPVRATVSPLRYPREADGLLLVVFEDYRVSSTKARGQVAGESDVQQLQDELKITREELQSTIEQLESSNDQLKASNEEVTAANEELQSANEEMETSKEELQSLNEELNTINGRLQEKVDELESTNNDVLNLLSSTSIATVFLDKELKVKRYTPAITRLLSLIPSDAGRPIADVLRRFSDEALLEDASRVLEDLTPLSKEVRAEDGRWYIRRITPYRTQDDRIEGVVVTFVDITDLHRTQQEREVTVEFLHLVNKSATTRDLARAAAIFFQEQSGCEAVGIRLKEGDDFPYYEARGLPEEFIRAESSLCARDAAGNVLRDGAGNPVMECMCGTVISGRFDPSKPIFTPAGSFWTNSTTELLAGTTDADRQARTRNRCHGEGYESVALIPLRVGAERLGLVQLNDRRGGMFSAEAIVLWERLADQLSVAVAKARAEEEVARLASFPVLNPHPVVEVDMDGRVCFTNPSSERLFPDLQQRGSAHPWLADWEAVAQACRESCGDLPDREVTVADRWYHQAMYYVPEAGRIRIYGLDITGRRKAEQALRENREDLARGQAVAHTGSWRLDVRQNELLWSDETYRIFGIPKGAPLTYETFLATVHPDDREYLDRKWAAAMGGELYDIEHRIIAGGVVKWVRERAELELDRQGMLLGGFGTVQDITERKRMEEELRRSHDELELRVQERTAELVKATGILREQAALLDLAHDAILVRDMDGTIVYWNSGARETYGWAREEALGKTAQTLLKTQFPKPVEEMVEDLLAGGQWEGELRNVTRKRKHIIVASRWAIQKDADNNPTGILEINRDITERKKAEEQLESYMAKLEESNQALQDFAFIASHDMQEPLRKVTSFGNLLKQRYRDSLGEEGRDYLDRMLNATDRMQSLLASLLEYSRVTARTEPFRKVELSTLLHEVLSDLEVRIEKTGAEIQVEELPVIKADPVQMRQLFQNLIGNALKFHQEGEKPLIKVWSARTDEDIFQIVVEDKGIGFDDKELERIFAPFQRLHGRSSRFEGTGMGLAICKKIVERHGGTITARSAPGEGATFVITLPAGELNHPAGEIDLSA